MGGSILTEREAWKVTKGIQYRSSISRVLNVLGLANSIDNFVEIS
jgi:hypothetical protein